MTPAEKKMFMSILHCAWVDTDPHGYLRFGQWLSNVLGLGPPGPAMPDIFYMADTHIIDRVVSYGKTVNKSVEGPKPGESPSPPKKKPAKDKRKERKGST